MSWLLHPTQHHPPPPRPPKKKREINHTSTDQEAGWVVANGINNGQNNEIKIKLYTK